MTAVEKSRAIFALLAERKVWCDKFQRDQTEKRWLYFDEMTRLTKAIDRIAAL